jgi:hypothetical protein
MNSIKFNLIALWLFLSLCFFSGCRKSEDSADVTSKSNSNKSQSISSRGDEIVTTYLKADASPFRKSRIRFTVTSETDPTKIYEVDVWRKQTEDETLTLSNIIKPAEDSGLSSLVDEVKDKNTVMTAYLPGTNQFREMGANKSLFGGIPAEELLGAWSKYDYKYIGEKNLDGVSVFELEGKLKPGKHAVAARMTAFFRADNNLPAELHLFDPGGKELRVFRIKNYQTSAGRNYVSKMEIENLIQKTNVVVEVLSMDFPNQIDDSVFTREQLKKNAGK